MIALCSNCGTLYEAGSEEQACEPKPLCRACVVAARSLAPPHSPPPRFREEECGGVFDGNQVISDADPGL